MDILVLTALAVLMGTATGVAVYYMYVGISRTVRILIRGYRKRVSD